MWTSILINPWLIAFVQKRGYNKAYKTNTRGTRVVSFVVIYKFTVGIYLILSLKKLKIHLVSEWQKENIHQIFILT
jgi:hypothetical protein